MKLQFQSLMVASGKVVEEERPCMGIVDVPKVENLDYNIESNELSLQTNSILVLETFNRGLLASLEASPVTIMEDIDAVKDGGHVGGVGDNHDGKFSSGSQQTKKMSERIELPSSRTFGEDGHGKQVTRELGDIPNGCKFGSGSREVNSGASTSHWLCHGRPPDASIPPIGHFVSSFHKEPSPIPDTLISTHHKGPIGVMLVKHRFSFMVLPKPNTSLKPLKWSSSFKNVTSLSERFRHIMLLPPVLVLRRSSRQTLSFKDITSFMCLSDIEGYRQRFAAPSMYYPPSAMPYQQRYNWG
ncbi:hypothetical protein Nepgr_033048 [Nepenthes gracilis]|uniref:Uncharacterized protein n=1 Tax=Nepenthes gracilis TaxID=150966 RepID=A0AAD3TJU6_NEPGR|nr:hypothetical protein Nepgr_033048 [Nepenthes gracilis]